MSSSSSSQGPSFWDGFCRGFNLSSLSFADGPTGVFGERDLLSYEVFEHEARKVSPVGRNPFEPRPLSWYAVRRFGGQQLGGSSVLFQQHSADYASYYFFDGGFWRKAPRGIVSVLREEKTATGLYLSDFQNGGSYFLLLAKAKDDGDEVFVSSDAGMKSKGLLMDDQDHFFSGKALDLVGDFHQEPHKAEALFSFARRCARRLKP